MLEKFDSYIQFNSVAHSCPTLWPHEEQHARPPCPLPIPGVSPKLCPLSQWCHIITSFSIIPFSSCPQSFSASGFFKWVSSSHQVAKVLEFQLQHQSSNEHPRLISFRMYWLDLLAVQGTLKSLLQYHSSKASILCSAFFIVQISHPYMTTGKTIALTRWTSVANVSAFFVLFCFCFFNFILF